MSKDTNKEWKPRVVPPFFPSGASQAHQTHLQLGFCPEMCCEFLFFLFLGPSSYLGKIRKKCHRFEEHKLAKSEGGLPTTSVVPHS